MKAAETADAVPPGLVFVNDDAPGIGRVRRGDGFRYSNPDGRPLRDGAQLERIRRLAIPPAYADVWICPLPNGHLQATGKDARGRKQYRYHAEWRRARDETKFDRMLEFGAALPKIRARVARDLARPVGEQVQRETVIATIVRLLDTTMMRIGNDEYARTNGSFGLTTLHNRHAAVSGSTLRLHFKGKSGVAHDVALEDKRVARIVKRCQALPGQVLFQHVDADGQVRGIGSADVNDYLRAASGGEFTAKDFRTWHGSVHALQLWRFSERLESPSQTQLRVATNALLGEVAGLLGNTVAVCRKSYVHPKVLSLMSGEHASDPESLKPSRKSGLDAAERSLMGFLKAAA